MLWHLRAPKAADASFIFNSWLKSFRDAPAVANMTHTVYYREVHRCIEEVFRSPNARVVMACDPAEEDVIFGYGVGEVIDDVFVVHFIYTKHSFRRFGMATALEQELLKNPHSSVAYSVHTKGCGLLIRAREYLYNPFYFWSRREKT